MGGHRVRRPGLRVVLVAITATAVALTGCGGGGGTGGTAKQITVAVSDSPSAQALKAIAPAFTKKTGVRVKFVDLPYDHLAAKVLLAARKREGYDVVQFDSPMLAPIVSGGGLADIGGRAKASKAYDLADFPAQVRDYAKYKGTTYALPLSTEPYVLWYNTKLFRAHGLKPPTTWPAYLAAAKKLHGANVYGSDSGYGSQIGAYYWLEQLYASGATLLRPGTCKPALTTKAAVEATRTYLQLRKYTPPTAVNGGGNEMTTAFVQGDVGQMVNATGYYSIMADPKQSKIVGDFDAALPPAAAGARRTLLFGWLIGVGKNSKAPDTAWQFLAFALGKGTAKTFIDKGAPPPARQSLLDDPTAKKKLPYLPTLVQAAKVGTHLPYIRQMPEIITAMSAQLSKAATSNQSAEELTTTANAKVAKILEGVTSC